MPQENLQYLTPGGNTKDSKRVIFPREAPSCIQALFLLFSWSTYDLRHIRHLLPDFLFDAIKSEREGTPRHYLEALEAFALSPMEFFHADNFSIKFASRVLLDASRDVRGDGTHADRDNEVGGIFRLVVLFVRLHAAAAAASVVDVGGGIVRVNGLSLAHLLHLLQGGVQFPTPEKDQPLLVSGHSESCCRSFRRDALLVYHRLSFSHIT